MEKMKDLAAHAGGVDVAALAPILRIEHLSELAQYLESIANTIHNYADREADTNLQMRLSMLRLEIERLSKDYSHAALQLGLKASLAMEEGK